MLCPSSRDSDHSVLEEKPRPPEKEVVRRRGPPPEPPPRGDDTRISNHALVAVNHRSGNHNSSNGGESVNSPVNNERRRSGGGETWRTADTTQRENESWRNVESGGQHLRSPDIGEKKPELRGSSAASGLAEARPDDRVSRMEERGSRMEDRVRMEDRGSRMDDRGLRMESSRFSPPRLRNRSTTPDEEDSTSFHETYEREMVRRRRGRRRSASFSSRCCGPLDSHGHSTHSVAGLTTSASSRNSSSRSEKSSTRSSRSPSLECVKQGCPSSQCRARTSLR